jgi:FkbM family methyltransferase
MVLDLSIPHHRLICLGVYEPGTVRLIQEILEEGDCFLDAGANIGIYSLIASGKVGSKGRVFAFDADPWNHQLCCENLQINRIDNVDLQRVALGETQRSARFISAKRVNSACSGLEEAVESVVSAEEGPGQGDEVIEVEMDTLDRLCAEVKGWSSGKVILKMDIEGAEPLAIDGATELIERLDGVIFEYNPLLVERLGFDWDYIPRKLFERGFEGFLIREGTGRLIPYSSCRTTCGNLYFRRVS